MKLDGLKISIISKSEKKAGIEIKGESLKVKRDVFLLTSQAPKQREET